MTTDQLATTAGGAIFSRLHRLGVDAVFVNSGTDFPPIIEGLAEADAHGLPMPRAIAVPHEHVAMSMAHGWYLATGRAQAVMLHTNVGLANGAIGAINAATDRVPVLLMSGRTPATERDRFGARTVPIGWGQEMRDQAALVREACKWDYEVRFPEQVPELLDRALAIATSTPAGPVYLSLPREVLCEPCPADELHAPVRQRPAIVHADPDLIDDCAELLSRAERPLIIAQRGAGTAAGFDALAQLAERWAIPVCQWWAVALAVADDHPCSVGPEPTPWLNDADVVLVVDSLAPWSPDLHQLGAGATVVQLGADPLAARAPVRHFPSDLTIVGEVGPALEALADALFVRDAAASPHVAARRARLAAHRAARAGELANAVEAGSREVMTKAYVAAKVGEAIAGRHATVVSELGAPLDFLRLTQHGSWHQEPHSGGLGWGLPCAMGMAMADPDRLVVATMGDGSYLFSNPVACHHVAEAHGIALLTVVLNNAGYGAVRRSVTDLYPTGYAAKADQIPLTGLSPSPDLTLVARSCRAWAETVHAPADLPAALQRALDQVLVHHRQAVLDVHIA